MASISLAPLSLNEGSAVTLLDVLGFVCTSDAVQFPARSITALRATSKAVKLIVDPYLYTTIQLRSYGLDVASRSPLLLTATAIELITDGVWRENYCSQLFALLFDLPKMTSLTVRMPEHGSDQRAFLSGLAETNWPRFKALIIHNVVIEDTNCIHNLAKASWFTSLEVFELHRPTLYRLLPAHVSLLLQAFNGRSLRVLHLEELDPESSEAFKGICLPQLEKLKLAFWANRRNIAEEQEVDLSPIFRADLPKLQVLSIQSDCFEHSVDWVNINTIPLVPPDKKIFPKLENLTLKLATISQECLRFIGREFVLKVLKSLKVWFLKHHGDFDMLSVLLRHPELPAVSAVPPLQNLELLSCRPGISDKLWKNLKKLSNLTNISIRETHPAPVWYVYGTFKSTGAAVELASSIELSREGLDTFLTFAEDFEVIKLKQSFEFGPKEDVLGAYRALKARYPNVIMEELVPTKAMLLLIPIFGGCILTQEDLIAEGF